MSSRSVACGKGAARSSLVQVQLCRCLAAVRGAARWACSRAARVLSGCAWQHGLLWMG